MKNIRKLLCALIVCATATSTVVSAEYEVIPYNAETVLPFGQETVLPLSDEDDSDIDSAIEYILSQIAESQPRSIDISDFNIPHLTDADGNRIGKTVRFFQKLQNTIRFERPELFYLSAYFTYKYTVPDRIISEMYFDNIPVTGYENGVEGYRIQSSEEIKHRQELIKEETDHIVSLTTDAMTPLQKVLIVNDYISANYKYDQIKESRTLDSMIIKKKGVCEGYTHLFYHVMRELGIPCVEVPSTDNAHIWNKVQLDGNWYNIDVTHNDVTFGNPTNNSRDYSGGDKHSHFLLTDAEIMTLDGCNQHTVWDDMTVNIADDSSFSNSVLRQINSFVVYKDGNFYCFDASNNFCTIDFENNALVPVYTARADDKWKPYGSPNLVYTGLKMSAPVLYKGDIYFNSPDKVYKFDTATNTADIVYTYDGTPDASSTYFFGMCVEDGQLYAEYSEDLNESSPTLIPVNSTTTPFPCALWIDPFPIKTVEVDASQKTFTIDTVLSNDSVDTSTVRVAQYDNNGVLIGLLSPDENGVYTCADNCKKVKAFLWNSDTHKPLAYTSDYHLD